ncbi:hypothetical protein NMY22_g14913 [Coprinellus aureogranulatus]|nr:hypothetical protein NMY22_g14913 [Coprinellus aureogranulatus]
MTSSDIEKKDGDYFITVQARDIDTAAMVAPEGTTEELDPDDANKLRRKIDKHLLPLMCFTFVIMIADQVVVAQSAILGIFEGAHLTQDQFNWLATILYITILALEYPQNLALQRFPIAKWMSLNIFVWAAALLAHAACKSFGALVACRVVLGMCESASATSFVRLALKFPSLNRRHPSGLHGCDINVLQAEGAYAEGWILVYGWHGGQQLPGLRSFRSTAHHGDQTHALAVDDGHNGHSDLHLRNLLLVRHLATYLSYSTPNLWHLRCVYSIFFPDSPTTARFLTPEERAMTVQRIKVNQSGVENKRWKREQFMETIRDAKVWIMAGFAFLSHVPVSMTFQKQIIVSQLGFNALQTTLLSCADGVVTILGISIGIYLSCIPAIGRGYATILTSIPPLVGSILINVLPSENKVALLFMYWLSFWVSVPYTLFLGWVTSLTAGHTKRMGCCILSFHTTDTDTQGITTNAIVLIAAYLGLAVGPLMWKKQYQPRNRIPWIIVSLCVFVSAVLLFALRTMLYLENRRRDRQPRSTKYDEVYVKKVLEDGTVEKHLVDKAFLDLTDVENKDFRYVL